jgi:hypothetical protein
MLIVLSIASHGKLFCLFSVETWWGECSVGWLFRCHGWDQHRGTCNCYVGCTEQEQITFCSQGYSSILYKHCSQDFPTAEVNTYIMVFVGWITIFSGQHLIFCFSLGVHLVGWWGYFDLCQDHVMMASTFMKLWETLGITRLHQTLTNVVIPTSNIKRLQPIILSAYEVWFFPTVLSSRFPLHHWKVVFQTCKIWQYTFVVDTHTLKVSPCLWQPVKRAT